MTAILYPVAANAEQALAAPLGAAEREREAEHLAGQAVVFTTDPTGPAFATREAALAAYGPDEPWRRLSEQILPGQKLPRAEATAFDTAQAAATAAADALRASGVVDAVANATPLSVAAVRAGGMACISSESLMASSGVPRAAMMA